MDTSTKIEQSARDTRKIAGEGDLLATDLRSIFSFYVDWFDCGRPRPAPAIAEPGTESARPSEQSVPNIMRVEEAARSFLFDRLAPALPVHFALAVLESLAYTTSRFAAADRANRLLYRAEAARILESGLLSETLSQRTKMSG